MLLFDFKNLWEGLVFFIAFTGLARARARACTPKAAFRADPTFHCASNNKEIRKACKHYQKDKNDDCKISENNTGVVNHVKVDLHHI